MQHEYATLTEPNRASLLVMLPVRDWSTVQRLDGQLGSVPGVKTVHSRMAVFANIAPAGRAAGRNDPFTMVTIGDCATLGELAQLGSCADGDVFLVTAGGARGGGVTLLKLVGARVVIDWPLIGIVCAASALVVLAVTALSLPVLWRLMRAQGLRTE